MMAKKLIVPNYELIHDGGGTHINSFTYRVSCDGLCADGTGRSKKDAKHEAAKAMLEAIAAHRGYPQLPASPAQSPIRTPLPPTIPEVERIPPSVPFVNAVGALQDLCTENNLNQPEYEQISAVGPAHAKIFTIHCKVATFVEAGVARTKKQAKQYAAKKMLDKLSDLVPDLSDTKQTEKTSSEIAKARYPVLSRLSSSKKINLGIKVKGYHNQLKDSVEEEIRKEVIEKLESLTSNNDTCITEEFVENLITKLKDIIAILSLEISILDLNSSNPAVYVAAMRINSSPAIVQVANGDTKLKAVYNTILKIINTVLFFLK
ncbi:RISC-loading complex subunit TARBP2 isoform X2 [Xylocopa sonorina]